MAHLRVYIEEIGSLELYGGHWKESTRKEEVAGLERMNISGRRMLV